MCVCVCVLQSVSLRRKIKEQLRSKRDRRAKNDDNDNKSNYDNVDNVADNDKVVDVAMNEAEYVDNNDNDDKSGAPLKPMKRKKSSKKAAARDNNNNNNSPTVSSPPKTLPSDKTTPTMAAAKATSTTTTTTTTTTAATLTTAKTSTVHGPCTTGESATQQAIEFLSELRRSGAHHDSSRVHAANDEPDEAKVEAEADKASGGMLRRSSAATHRRPSVFRFVFVVFVFFSVYLI